MKADILIEYDEVKTMVKDWIGKQVFSGCPFEIKSLRIEPYSYDCPSLKVSITNDLSPNSDS